MNITCEHCDSEIDVEKDPGCIQHGGMYVVCKACRDKAYDRWKKTVLNAEWPPDITERLREAFRIKRGWRA